jgi:hypothetical protein
LDERAEWLINVSSLSLVFSLEGWEGHLYTGLEKKVRRSPRKIVTDIRLSDHV